MKDMVVWPGQSHRVLVMAVLAVMLVQSGIGSVVFWSQTLFAGAGAIAPLRPATAGACRRYRLTMAT